MKPPWLTGEQFLRGARLICIVSGSVVIFILFVLTEEGDLSAQDIMVNPAGRSLPSPIWIEHTLGVSASAS